jgi:hypothetical protein
VPLGCMGLPGPVGLPGMGLPGPVGLVGCVGLGSPLPAAVARRATLYGSPVCAIRSRAAVLGALFRVMIFSSRRGSPRRLAKTE